MTPLERRGRTIYLVLATLILLSTLSGVILALGADEIRWRHSVFAPLCFAAAVVWLWRGEPGLRWLVGLGCLVNGVPTLAAVGRLGFALAQATEPGDWGFFMQLLGGPFAVLGLYGLFYIVAGLMFMFWPALQAFYRYQREGADAAVVEPIE